VPRLAGRATSRLAETRSRWRRRSPASEQRRAVRHRRLTEDLSHDWQWGKRRRDASATYRRHVHIEHTALIVENYDDAIRFFVDALGFDLVEDSPATTNDGRPKRWVVVSPPEAQTGLLLAEPDGERQVDAIGRQYAGRVGLFLRVDDFAAARRRMLDHGVEFVTEPRDEPYGRVAVFLDLSGNRWDLLGPRT
jgi:catechol 2,3-dioxygenase-like lactoylglutathione lyase family enzyme